MNPIFASIALLATVAGSAAAAPSGKSPYADLLPANITLHAATERLDPQVLKRSTLALIPTSRFLKQTKDWQKFFGEKGERIATGTSSVTPQTMQITATAMEPRRVVDAAMAQLEPRFGSVRLFDDLASAREGGAQYFLLLDYDSSYIFGLIGAGALRGSAGGLLLNPSFQRVFEVAVDRKTPVYSGGLLGGANSELVAWAKTVEGNFTVLLPAFSAAVDGAFTERGVSMPVVAPPPVAPIVAAVAPSAPTAPSERDAAYESRLELAANAGELYVLGDEMAEKGDKVKAAQAFRAIISRFPDNPLAAKAADRLATLR